MKPLFKKNASSIGNIMDGSIVVGTYKMHTAEDSYGYRKLYDIQIMDMYVDKVNNKSNADLSFVYKDKASSIKIEELGRGRLAFNTILYSYGGVLPGNIAIVDSATFIKLPSDIEVNQNAN